MIKRIITVLLIISICFLAFFIVSTYAKYSTELSKSTNITFKKWNVLINTTDIKNNSNFSANLTPVITYNEHISSDIIAPTSSGYFDIVIDSSNTDLPFSFLMTFNYTDTEIQDFRIIEYSLNGGINNPMPLDDITGSIAANVDSTTYRFFVEWNDDSNTNITNNAEDTQLALSNANSQVNVIIYLEQTSI